MILDEAQTLHSILGQPLEDVENNHLAITVCDNFSDGEKVRKLTNKVLNLFNKYTQTQRTTN